MNPRQRAAVAIATLVAALVLLVLLFPRAAAFAELAARELRYFWWLILIVALAIWLIWGVGRKPRR
jgi:predicted membrane protein